MRVVEGPIGVLSLQSFTVTNSSQCFVGIYQESLVTIQTALRI